MTARAAFYGSTAKPVYPVWKNSLGVRAKAITFKPLAKRDAVKLWHHARRFERFTRIRKNCQDGTIGRNGILILQALLFDCIDYVSGRLDPSYEGIARLANISIRSVSRGLAKLKAAGVIDWTRHAAWNDARGQLVQETNAYRIKPAQSWPGFSASPDAPPLTAADLGAPAPVDPILDAADALRRGQKREAQSHFDLEPPGTIGAALARLNRTRTP